MSSRRRPRGFKGCRGGLGRVRDDAGRVELARCVRARRPRAASFWQEEEEDPLAPSGLGQDRGWAGASVTGHKGELQVTFCSILFSFCFSFI